MSSAFQSAALNPSTMPGNSSEWVEAVRASSAASDLDKHQEGQNTQSCCGDNTRENFSTDSPIKCQRDQPRYRRTLTVGTDEPVGHSLGAVESENVSVTKAGGSKWLIRVMRELSAWQNAFEEVFTPEARC